MVENEKTIPRKRKSGSHNTVVKIPEIRVNAKRHK